MIDAIVYTVYRYQIMPMQPMQHETRDMGRDSHHSTELWDAQFIPVPSSTGTAAECPIYKYIILCIINIYIYISISIYIYIYQYIYISISIYINIYILWESTGIHRNIPGNLGIRYS